MKKLLFIVLFSLILHASIGFAFDDEPIEVYCSTKKTSSVDYAGDIWFSIKCKVVNNSGRAIRGVNIQGIDSQGYEMKSIPLVGAVEDGEERVLTTNTYLNYKQYKSISKWRVQ